MSTETTSPEKEALNQQLGLAIKQAVAIKGVFEMYAYRVCPPEIFIEEMYRMAEELIEMKASHTEVI